MSEYQLDGADLDDPQGRWLLTSATTLPSWGAPRLTSVEVPHRTGVLPVAPATTGPVKVTLGLLVDAPTRAGLDAALRALAARMRVTGRLMVLRHSPAGAPPRQALVRLAGGVEPEAYPASSAVALTVVLEAPEGVWRDPDPVEAPAQDLSALDGGVAPVPDALVLVSSPGARVRVVDGVSGSSLTWEGTPVPDRALLLDAAAYRASLVPAGAWSHDGGADVSAGLSASSGGLRLTPDPATSRVSLSVSGGSARVRARRAY